MFSIQQELQFDEVGQIIIINIVILIILIIQKLLDHFIALCWY